MRLIDADELSRTVRANAYPIRYDYKFSSTGLGMSLDGIEEAIDNMPAIESWEYEGLKGSER